MAEVKYEYVLTGIMTFNTNVTKAQIVSAMIVGDFYYYYSINFYQVKLYLKKWLLFNICYIFNFCYYCVELFHR